MFLASSFVDVADLFVKFAEGKCAGKTFSALNMIDFYPVPHHTNFPFKESVQSIIASYQGKLDLCPISNTEAIVVRGNKFEVWAG